MYGAFPVLFASSCMRLRENKLGVVELPGIDVRVEGTKPENLDFTYLHSPQTNEQQSRMIQSHDRHIQKHLKVPIEEQIL